jgi:hypothetical protein
MDHERRPAIRADRAARGSRADHTEPSARFAVERAHGGIGGGESSARFAVERAHRRVTVRKSYGDRARSGHTVRHVVAAARVDVVAAAARSGHTARHVVAAAGARVDVVLAAAARVDVVSAAARVDVVVAPAARLS